MSESGVPRGPRHAAADEAETESRAPAVEQALERARDELDHDRRVERMLLWKGVLALLFVLVVAYVRQRYFL